MPTNHYFQGGNGIGSSEEKKLFENLIIEGLKIYGHDVYYLPRTLVNKDLILATSSPSIRSLFTKVLGRINNQLQF